MSIRLRLILLYSGILFLTLLVFGVTLYTIQAQDTLESLKNDLRQASDRLANLAISPENQTPRDAANQDPPPPKTFNDYSDEPVFQDLREREIVRILDGEGNLVASPFGRNEDALPLSAEGLRALQDQQEWWSEAVVSEESMLIYHRPIIGEEGTTVAIIQLARSLTERDRTLRSLAVTLGFAGGVMVLVAFAAGWILSGASLRPIDRITHTAQMIGNERDFSQRVDYVGPEDEVGRLASTFNLMLSRLQEAYLRVEHSLKKQRDFVADVSHELRTPLTTLRGNLGLLRRDPSMPVEEQDDILGDMVEESDRLIRLVNDLLLLARAEAGRNFLKQPVKVLPLVEETMRGIRLLAPERTILMEIPGGLEVFSDPDIMKQVLLILIDNAIKHSDGDIHVAANYGDSGINIVVQDHGEGIDPAYLPHVFDRFYRGEEASGTPGFGLGLPIAKAQVEGLGGHIHVKSKVGQGSTFTVNFPKMK